MFGKLQCFCLSFQERNLMGGDGGEGRLVEAGNH